MDTQSVEQPRPPILIDSGTSQYTDHDRREAVSLYLATGKASHVARTTGIPESTLCMWRKTEWWDDLSVEIGMLIDDEMRALLRDSAIKAQRNAIEKLPDASAKDSAIIASIAIDKLRLLDGKPTRITGNDRIDGLAAQLAKLSDQVNAKLVSEQ